MSFSGVGCSSAASRHFWVSNTSLFAEPRVCPWSSRELFEQLQRSSVILGNVAVLGRGWSGMGGLLFLFSVPEFHPETAWLNTGAQLTQSSSGLVRLVDLSLPPSLSAQGLCALFLALPTASSYYLS